MAKKECCSCQYPPIEPVKVYERLIFVMPKKSYPEHAVSIETDSDEYSPGDLVDLQITINADQLENFDADEDIFAKVTVTDISSLLSVPSHKQQPSLPSMVYLEREVKLVGVDTSVPELLEYSNEFLDANFDLNRRADDIVDYNNLDLLLGNQNWRKNVFTGGNWVPYEAEQFLSIYPPDCYTYYYDDWG